MFKERNMATASRYVFTGSALPENSNKGQLELCVRHLRILGSATAEELAQAIKPELKTVQTPERIAAYYLCVLKKAGSVRTVDAATPRTSAQIEDEIARHGAAIDALELELNEVRGREQGIPAGE
jgi:hypothetical protein